MIYEFAVEPSLLCNWAQFNHLIEKFGFQQGRLISRCPTRWENAVKEVLKTANVTVMQRQKMIEILANIDHKMVARDVQWLLNLDWLENAERAHAKHAFHAILANKNPRNHGFVLPYEDLTEDNALWATQSQRVVQRQAAEMARTLLPVFRIAVRLVFIDPNFDPCKAPAMRALKAYLRQCRTISPYPQIEYHTKFNPGNTLFKSKCMELESSIPVGQKITMICWENQNITGKPRDGMHNRYVLTNRGGLSLGWGLDEGKVGQTDDVIILTQDVYKERWEQYCGTTPAFTKTLAFPINGNAS